MADDRITITISPGSYAIEQQLTSLHLVHGITLTTNLNCRINDVIKYIKETVWKSKFQTPIYMWNPNQVLTYYRTWDEYAYKDPRSGLIDHYWYIISKVLSYRYIITMYK